MLLNEEKSYIPERYLMHVNNDVIKKDVVFIFLSPKNVVPKSYEVKEVTLSPEGIVTLPKLQRKNLQGKIDEDHKYHTINDEEFISRDTFYQIINKKNAYDQASLNAVDNVTSKLVNEIYEVLQSFVDMVILLIN